MKKATPIKKGAQILKFQKGSGVGVMKFKAPATKTYTFTFTNVNSPSKYTAGSVQFYNMTASSHNRLTIKLSEGKRTIAPLCSASLADGSKYTSGNATFKRLKTRTVKLRINKGKLDISTGDDGIHTDTKLEISGGEIVIAKSYEGIEAQDIAISGGYIDITSSDDGLNAAGGSDGNNEGDRMWQDRFNTSQNVSFVISGGELYVNAQGDGVDSNGSLTISGGAVFVSGPTNSGNGYIDIGEGGCTFNMNGGIYLGVGTSGMLVTPSADSQQNSITASVSGSAGSTVTVKDADGKELVSFKSAKQFDTITVSHPEIEIGDKVTVFIDGTESAVLECTSVSTGSDLGGGHGGPGGMPPQGGKPNGRPM
jgi:hypothetical protein